MLSIFTRMLGGRKSVGAPRMPSGNSTQGVRDTRREILLMAVRDTLRKNGIPNDMMGVETFPATTPTKTKGVHLRLVVKEPQARLLQYARSFEGAIQSRLLRLDPLAGQWMAGVSWRLDGPASQVGPALPPASYWQSVPAPGDKSAAAPRRSTLDRLFDKHPSDSKGSAPTGFSPTQPMIHR